MQKAVAQYLNAGEFNQHNSMAMNGNSMVWTFTQEDRSADKIYICRIDNKVGLRLIPVLPYWHNLNLSSIIRWFVRHK